MSSKALSLYRSILRAHAKHLPTQMRNLGDAYVKSEFQLHKGVTKPEQLNQFFVAWEEYLDQILATARAQETISAGALDVRETETEKSPFGAFGKDLPQDVSLNDEQVEQLEKLREETSKAGKTL